MNIDAIIPWVCIGAGAIQAATAIRDRRAGRPGGHAAPGVIFMAMGISQLTSGWVRAIAWVVMGVYGVPMTVRLFRDRTLSGLVFSIPLCALMLVIAVTEVSFDDIATWQRVLFGAIAAFIAAALVAMTVHLVQRLRTRRSTL
jgi:hypothetical protein